MFLFYFSPDIRDVFQSTTFHEIGQSSNTVKGSSGIPISLFINGSIFKFRGLKICQFVKRKSQILVNIIDTFDLINIEWFFLRNVWWWFVKSLLHLFKYSSNEITRNQIRSNLKIVSQNLIGLISWIKDPNFQVLWLETHMTSKFGLFIDKKI